MALDIAAIRDGVATRLATVSGLRVHDTIPDDITPPAAVVQVASVKYQEAFAGGLAEVRLRVTLVASKSSDRSGQNKLDAYLSSGTGQSSSIVDAIEADPTLDGSVDSAAISDDDIDYGVATFGSTDYWKADLYVVALRDRS